ncbi:MAG: NYN domain-containing protein [bacterium]|nr:NYN domain-containing protein [bacterium]
MGNIIYVFIDASNLWQAQKAKGKLFDFEKLTKYLKNKFQASELKVFYYTAYPADGTRSYDLSPRHKFFTFLKKGLGFEVRKKELKRIHLTTEQGQAIQEKGNMDVEITIDAMFHIEKYHLAILFSGDSDFLALVSHLKNNGKKVYIFSSKNNISEELKTGGDGYSDVLKIEEDIWGHELKHRTEQSSKPENK